MGLRTPARPALTTMCECAAMVPGTAISAWANSKALCRKCVMHSMLIMPRINAASPLMGISLGLSTRRRKTEYIMITRTTRLVMSRMNLKA